MFTNVQIWATSGQEVNQATFGHFWSVHFVENIHTPCNFFFLKQMVECHKVSKKRKKKQTVSAVLRFLPFHARAHKSSACNAWTAAALRLIWRMLPPRITLAAIVLFIPRCQCLTSDGNMRFNYISFFSFVDVDCIYDLSFSCVFLTVSVLTLILEWFPSTHA